MEDHGTLAHEPIHHDFIRDGINHETETGMICEVGDVFKLSSGEVVNDRYLVTARQERFG